MPMKPTDPNRQSYRYRRASERKNFGKVRGLFIPSSVNNPVNPVATCCNRRAFPQRSTRENGIGYSENF